MVDNSLQKIRVGAKPLSRPLGDRLIFGVCSGLARKLGISSNLGRIIYSVLAVITGVIPLVLLYAIAFLIIPQE
jgi:phage shock protein C